MKLGSDCRLVLLTGNLKIDFVTANFFGFGKFTSRRFQRAIGGSKIPPLAYLVHFFKKSNFDPPAGSKFPNFQIEYNGQIDFWCQTLRGIVSPYPDTQFAKTSAENSGQNLVVT